MASPLLVNVAELLRQPGARKAARVSAMADELEINDPRIDSDAEVTFDAQMESMSDGIVVMGEVSVQWHDSCRRCVRPVGGMVRSAVRELFQQHVTDEDAFPITGEQIDLRPMVHDIVLLDTPVAALCRDDCAGLCPTCGADRNDGPCACDVAQRDDRWDALDQLRDKLA